MVLTARVALEFLKNRSKLFYSISTKPLNSNVLQKSNLSYFNFSRKSGTNYYRIKDNVSDQYELIYRNGMHRYFLFAQIISSVSVIGVSVMYMWESEVKAPKFENWKMVPKTFESDTYLILSAFILLNTVLQLALFKCPIRIYNNPNNDKYIMIFYKYIPFRTSRLSCKVRDITKLEETGILPWKNSSYQIQDSRTIIMLDNFFRKPADLNIMLGYQKHTVDNDKDY